MENKTIEVGLRIQAKFDEARAAVAAFKSDLIDLGKTSKAVSAQPVSAPAALPAPVPVAAPAAPAPASATRHAPTATDEEKAALERLTAALVPAAGNTERLAAAQTMLDNAYAKGAISQERYTQLHGAALQKYDEERVSLQRLTAELQPAATSTDRLAAAQKTLSNGLASGLITQERHNQLLQVAQQRYASTGVSAGQTAAALRGVPAQLTDIVVGLQGGQAPLTVLLQQGGQLKDMFGGIAPAARALGGSLLGMVNIYTLAAAAAAALGVAFMQGSKEAEGYSRAIILSGNASGTTAGQLQGMAKSIDGVVGTQSAAAEALTQFAASGTIANSSLERFTTVALKMEKEVGQSIDTTVKQFTELGKAPVDASVKLNEQYHYLTASVYQQIQALMEQGRTEEAGALAQKSFADAMEGRTQQLSANLGTLERGWRAVKGAAAEAWDAMLGIGRKQTAQDQLDAVGKQIAAARTTQANGGFASNAGGAAFGRGGAGAAAQDKALQSLLAQQAALQEGVRLEQRGASLTADRAASTERIAKWTKEGAQYESTGQKRTKALEATRTQNEQLLRDGTITQRQADQRMADVQDKLKDKGGGGGRAAPKGPSAFRTASADAGVAMAQIKSDLGLLQASIKIGDAIIVKALEDGQVSIADAYAARQAQLEVESKAQREALQAELKEVDAALTKAGNSAEQGPLKQKRIVLVAQVTTLDANLQEESRKLSLWKSDQEKQLASITAKVRVDVSNITGTFDKGAVEAQLKQQYQPDFDAAGRLDKPEDQAAAQQRVQLLLAAGTAQAEFNFRLGEAQRLQATLGAQEAGVQQQVQAGTLSQIEAEGRLRGLRADQVPALQAIVQQMQAIRDALPPEAAATLSAMSVSVSQLQTTVAAATPTVVDFGTQLRVATIDSISGAVGQAVTDFKNLRQVVGNTLKQILGNILSSGIKSALTDAFTPKSGAGGSAGGSSAVGGLWSAFLGWASSGSAGSGASTSGYAEGGHIQGPGTGTSDSIPALVGGVRPIAVSNNEFIQPERAVQHYGLAFMEAVRTLRLPKPQFAFGGLVSAHQQARFATGGMVKTGSAAVAPIVQLNFTNAGTPQEVRRRDDAWDGKQMVISLVLADLQNGGPISRGINSAQNRR